MKEKQKTDSIKRPSAMIHMALWGLGSGWLMTALYIVLTFVIFGGWQYFTFGMLGELLKWLALIGGIAGLILGIIDGTVISFLLRDFHDDNFAEIRRESQWIVAAVTGLGMALPLLMIMGIFFFSALTFTLPAILIASAAAYFATGNYFKRLANMQIEKPKHDASSRLADKLKHDENDDVEEEAMSRKDETS